MKFELHSPEMLVFTLFTLFSSTLWAADEPIHGTPTHHQGKHRDYEYFGDTPKELAKKREQIREWEEIDRKREEKLQALPLKVERIDGHIIAFGLECPQLQNRAELLGVWRKALDRNWIAPAMRDCQYNFEKKRFELNLDEWAPPHVLEHLGVQNNCGGFNCVNNALGATGFLDDPHYTGQTPFETLMKSKMCHRITDAANVQPGDIVTIGSNPDRRPRPSHVYVHVAADLAYEKADYDKRPVRFSSPSFIFENWNVTPECYPNGIDKPECSQNRARWAVVFRCKPEPIPVPDPLKPYIAKAEARLKLTRSWLREKLPEDVENYQNMHAEARKQNFEAEAIMKDAGVREMPADDALPWQMAFEKIYGSEAQTDFTGSYANWRWWKHEAFSMPIDKAMQRFRDFETRQKALELGWGSHQTDSHISMLAIRLVDNTETDLPVFLASMRKTDYTGLKAVEIALQLEPAKMRKSLEPYRSKYPWLETLLSDKE